MPASKPLIFILVWGNYPAALTTVTDGLAITEDASSGNDAWHIGTLAGDGNSHTARLYIAASLHQILAFLYDNVGDVPNTVAQYRSAIDLAWRVNNKEELSLDYMSLGTVYTAVNKLDLALLSEKLAYDNAIQSGYKIYLGFILNSIGTIYYLGGKYPEATSYYHRALLASREQKNRKDEIDALLFLAKLKRRLGQADSLSKSRIFSITSTSLLKWDFTKNDSCVLVRQLCTGNGAEFCHPTPHRNPNVTKMQERDCLRLIAILAANCIGIGIAPKMAPFERMG